jgi:hypothetical protein
MEEQLPSFLLAELFTDSIVSITENIPKQSVKKEIPLPKKIYLGNYEKKIAILVNDADNPYLSDETLSFLTGILNACKLNLAHVALINFHNNPVNFQFLRTKLSAEFLLLFGVTPLQIELPFTMPHYQVQKYDKCSTITAPSLAELSIPAAKQEKMKLWQSLKKMFDL